ncbi:hypothetical protein MaudCBS49596_005314 [Microsporum audouinii]
MSSINVPEKTPSEIIVVSPTVTRAPLQNIQDRIITPLSERKTPKHIAVVSPLGSFPRTSSGHVNSHLFTPSRRLFPAGEAIIEERASLCPGHAHPSIPPWRHQFSRRPFPRHIILDFDISKEPVFDEKCHIFYDIIPTTTSVIFDGRFLIFTLAALPDQPWPKRIAGVPCYFTTVFGDLGPSAPIHRPNFSHIHICRELNYRNDEGKAELVFNVAKEHFIAKGISITEIQYWGNFIVIVLEHRNTDRSALPQSVTGCSCFYLYDDEMGRPLNLSALRLTEPSPGTLDTSQYETLRPGVMLSSGKHPTEGWELVTSSGVLIQDRNGHCYLTAASHGFPCGDRVFHPNSNGNEIGRVIMEITHTDVALIELYDKSSFRNELFQNTIAPGPPVQLQRFATLQENRVLQGRFIYMDSPFTGYIEGTQGVLATSRILEDDPHEPKQVWVATRWDYMGQGSSNALVDGVCGSAIWNDEGNVIGFFRYAPKSGHFLDWCMSISSSELIDRGYSIVRG